MLNTHYEAAKNTFVITVEVTPKLWKETRRNKWKTIGYDHVQPMQWRHLNVFNKECLIACPCLGAICRGGCSTARQGKDLPGDYMITTL